MKILITGGAGCLGSNLIERWIPLGHSICVIDNFATGKKEVVPEIEGLDVVEGSIADKKLVNRTFQSFKPDLVIHSAASYKDPNNWEEDVNTNVLGTLYVVNAAIEAGVKKLINFQTALCYGRPGQIPIPISHPTMPFTSYGISKTAGEAILMQQDIQVISLRLANICGPRLAIGPIPTFYTRLKSGKSCFCSDTVRDFLDMDDFFDLMDIIIDDSCSVSGIFNVSTGKGYSILDVFNAVADYLGIKEREVPVVPAGADDVQQVVLDPVETERVFGWKAKTDFITTINNQLKWYDKYGVNDIFSHLKNNNNG
ncbi:MAG: NAD-dependent epimerase/dehydratase family protein [Saprospiraceae bacterium]|nr:NAD-dependent epimerase/dehydratase family protein [Saprospiraceae bacterium]